MILHFNYWLISLVLKQFVINKQHVTLTASEPDSTMSPGCGQHSGTISENLYTENTSLLHTCKMTVKLLEV